MIVSQIKDLIIQSINEEQNCWMHFKIPTRAPLVGRFVAKDDFDDQWSKGFVRFVSIDQISNFLEDNHVKYTRLYSIAHLSYIKLLEDAKIT